jgi:hypothetical protein
MQGPPWPSRQRVFHRNLHPAGWGYQKPIAGKRRVGISCIISQIEPLLTKELVMQNRIFYLSIFIVLIVAMNCFAGGTYQVGQDQGGIYFQTDNDGGWYIDKRDLKDFKIGQTGNYSIGKDQNGTFLFINKNRKYYLDTKAKDKQNIENAKVNQEYERKMESMRQIEAQRKKEQMRLKEEKQKEQARLQDNKRPKVEHYQRLQSQPEEVEQKLPLPSRLKIERNYVPVAPRKYLQYP